MQLSFSFLYILTSSIPSVLPFFSMFSLSFLPLLPFHLFPPNLPSPQLFHSPFTSVITSGFYLLLFFPIYLSFLLVSPPSAPFFLSPFPLLISFLIISSFLTPSLLYPSFFYSSPPSYPSFLSLFLFLLTFLFPLPLQSLFPTFSSLLPLFLHCHQIFTSVYSSLFPFLFLQSFLCLPLSPVPMYLFFLSLLPLL